MSDLSRLTSSLPEGFDFYHLGKVEPAPNLTDVEGELDIEPQHMLWDSLSEDVKIGYRIHGDVDGVLVIGFEQGLDLSTYMELGNVIASKIVTALSAKDGLDALISPPQQLTQKTLERLARPDGPVEHRIYLHRNGMEVHAVHVFLALAQPAPEGTSNA
jgi:hypothetical protein